MSTIKFSKFVALGAVSDGKECDVLSNGAVVGSIESQMNWNEWLKTSAWSVECYTVTIGTSDRTFWVNRYANARAALAAAKAHAREICA